MGGRAGRGRSLSASTAFVPPPLTSTYDSYHAVLRDCIVPSPLPTVLLSQEKLTQVTNPLPHLSSLTRNHLRILSKSYTTTSLFCPTIRVQPQTRLCAFCAPRRTSVSSIRFQAVRSDSTRALFHECVSIEAFRSTPLKFCAVYRLVNRCLSQA